MRITASAISLNVDDVPASAAFATKHFGFREEMAADGFVSLSREDVGFNLVFLRTGLATFKPDAMRGRRADGLLVVLVVDDIDGEYRRLLEAAVPITTPSRRSPGASGSSRSRIRTGSCTSSCNGSPRRRGQPDRSAIQRRRPSARAGLNVS